MRPLLGLLVGGLLAAAALGQDEASMRELTLQRRVDELEQQLYGLKTTMSALVGEDGETQLMELITGIQNLDYRGSSVRDEQILAKAPHLQLQSSAEPELQQRGPAILLLLLAAMEGQHISHYIISDDQADDINRLEADTALMNSLLKVFDPDEANTLLHDMDVQIGTNSATLTAFCQWVTTTNPMALADNPDLCPSFEGELEISGEPLVFRASVPSNYDEDSEFTYCDYSRPHRLMFCINKRNHIVEDAGVPGVMEIFDISNPYVPEYLDTLSFAGSSHTQPEGVAFSPDGEKFVVTATAGVDESRQGALFYHNVTQFMSDMNAVAGLAGEKLALALLNTVPLEDNIAGDNTESLASPTHVVFTPDGSKFLVAVEGRPYHDSDPPGAVCIYRYDAMGKPHLNGSGDGACVRFFQSFPDDDDDLRRSGVRIFGSEFLNSDNANTDLQPHFIAVDKNSAFAYVSLQQNNAMVKIDIANNRVVDDGIRAFPLKEWGHVGAPKLDASLEDGQADQPAVRIRNYPVHGLYMPDQIGVYEVSGTTYIVTANEGFARDDDRIAVGDIALRAGVDGQLNIDDALLTAHFPPLTGDGQLGELEVSKFADDGAEALTRLEAFGGRSFSIWTEPADTRMGTGSSYEVSHWQLVYDSGDFIEEYIAEKHRDLFNVNNEDLDSFDAQSIKTGPGPQGLMLREIEGKWYLFLTLGQTGGIMTFDVSAPRNPIFKGYINNRAETGDRNLPIADSGEFSGPRSLSFIQNYNDTDHSLLLVSLLS
ncbi:unnamed protein product [Chrysoparadoxa australica]